MPVQRSPTNGRNVRRVRWLECKICLDTLTGPPVSSIFLDMKFNTNREDNMIRTTLIIDKLNRKACALQSAGKWEAADRLLILALRIGG